MAKVAVVGDMFRKTSYCPQCRKKVPAVNRTDKGVKCPRCGFFTWEEYKKFPSFTSIPEPDEKSAQEVDELLDRKESVKKGKEMLERKLSKGKGKDAESSMASRPQLEGSADRRSGKDKPPSGKSSAKKSSGGSAKSKSAKGKKPTGK